MTRFACRARRALFVAVLSVASAGRIGAQVRRVPPGGVYIGVAPDQNFTLVSALRPGIAFIVDIRHQNAVQHLMYKALIEMSKDRADFLARLFARAPLEGVDTTSSAAQLFEALSRP